MQKKTKEPIKLEGRYRLEIEEDGKIISRSKWYKNQITVPGIELFLARTLGKIAGSLQVGYAALGTGTAPSSTTTGLPNELAEGVRDAVTAATTNSSSGVRFVGTFASAESFVTANRTIQNIGLFQTDSGGTLFAGNTYATSQVQTNQNVNYSYQINFGTS